MVRARGLPEWMTQQPHHHAKNNWERLQGGVTRNRSTRDQTFKHAITNGGWGLALCAAVPLRNRTLERPDLCQTFAAETGRPSATNVHRTKYVAPKHFETTIRKSDVYHPTL